MPLNPAFWRGAEGGRSLLVCSQPGLHRKSRTFRATEKNYLEKPTKQLNKQTKLRW